MDTQNPDPTQVAHIMAAVLPILALVFIVAQALFIVPLWVSLKKAGLPPALSLIGILPTLGPIIVLFILAFSTWKVVPASQYPATYPGQISSPAYPPVYAQSNAPLTPAATNYSAPGAYTPSTSSPSSAAYPPPPTEPPTHL